MSVRACGSCQLCCTLVPVKDIGKDAGERCGAQCAKGCAIYDRRPRACRMWSCAWLLDPRAEMKRPDRAHYVIDIIVDKIALNDGKGGVQHLDAAQVWIDPKYKDAHRDPALRAYLLSTGVRGLAIIRYSSKEGIVLVPPHMNPTGDWLEKESGYVEDLPPEA